MQPRNGADQWVWYIVGLGWQSLSARLSLFGVSGLSALAGGRMRMCGLKQKGEGRGLRVVLSVLVWDALPSTSYLCTVLSNGSLQHHVQERTHTINAPYSVLFKWNRARY